MFARIEEQLLGLIDVLPLELFVFVASFVEEVIAPIPSPTVMVLAGSFASLQEYLYPGLVLLAVIGALGKTLGAGVVYAIVVTFEDAFIPRFGRFFGVTTEDITAFGARLSGTPRDYAILTLVRSLPFIPSVVVSVGGGILKIPIRMFLVTTFIGTIIRDGIYLYAGYAGLKVFETFLTFADRTESLITAGVILTTLVIVVWLYWKTRRASL